ncbi:MAG: hypothetical protein LWY06_06600 [Firmicutes bacterium]|nr:hypothetical protein [Bacillota bacterium]
MKAKVTLALAILFVFAIGVFGSVYAQSTEPEHDLENVPYWWKGKNFTGEITRMDSSKITVVDKDKITKEFQIDSQTKIFLREADKLSQGVYVKIVYKETKQVNIAKAIREIKKP